MDSLSDIIEHQSLRDSLVVETISIESTTDHNDNNQSHHNSHHILQSNHDHHHESAFVMIGGSGSNHIHISDSHHHVSSPITRLNNENSNGNSTYSLHNRRVQVNHGDMQMSPESAVSLESLTINTGVMSRSRTISHGNCLELIKQEHTISNSDMITANDDISSDGVESSIKHQAKHKTLTVIVQPNDDSHDDASQLLSPGKLTPSSELLDSSEFRSLHEPTYQTLTSVSNRISPTGFTTSPSYATLTPLQPLPPISTMSDKFAYGHGSNVSGSFTVMQNNNMGLSLGMGATSPYNYEKLPAIGMSPPHNYSSPTNTLGGIVLSQQPSPLSPQSSYSQNGGLHSPQKSLSPHDYESSYHHRDILVRQSLQQQSPNALSPHSASLHSPSNTILNFGNPANSNGSNLTLNSIQCSNPTVVTSMSNNSPGLVQIAHVNRDAVIVHSPSPPLLAIHHTSAVQHTSNIMSNQIKNNPNSSHSAITTNNNNINNHNNNTSSTPVSVTSISNDVEEINTKELAQRISAELKRYSIPQAIFAQRVLCRSQGTLSDLLRNPKPWSKLKSGRETFRRMFKWLQEPEFQRMSALRLAGKIIISNYLLCL